MSETDQRPLLAKRVARRQVLAAGLAAGAAAFIGAAGANRARAQSASPAPTPAATGDGSFAGVMLNGFSGGYSLNAEYLALGVWNGLTGGNATFTNVPFDQKPVTIAGIIATQDASWDTMYTYDKFMQQFGARVLLPFEGNYTGDLADFSPSILPSFTSQADQVLRGLPIHFGGYLWAYNKAVYEDIGQDPENPPGTWAELFDLVPKFLEKGYIPSVQPWLGADGTFGDFYFKQMYNAFGVPFLSEDRTQVKFDGPEGLRTFETIEAGLKSGFWDAATLNVTNEHDAFVIFDQGQVGSIIDGGDNERTLPDDVYGIKNQPGIDPGTTGSVEGSDGLGVSKFSTRQPASWSFINTMFSPDVARRIVLETDEHYPPARVSLLSDPEVQALNPRIAAWGEQAKGQVNLWSAPYNYSPVFDDVIHKLVDGEYSAQQAHDAAVTGVQDLITQYLIA